MKPGTSAVGLFVLALLTLISPASTRADDCTPAPSGLVAWWPGEGNSLDARTNHTGYRSNGVAYATGKVGQAFSFTNKSAVFISNAPAFNLTNYSFEAWIKPTAQPDNLEHQGVIISQPYGIGSLMVRSANTGVVVTLLFDQPSWYREVVSSELPLNQFAHVVGTWDGTTLRMYINGVLQAQNTPDLQPVLNSSWAFYLGGIINHTYNDYVECFRGLIDEPSIYNRALSSNEIAALYQAGAAGKCGSVPPPPVNCTPAPSGLVGWWPGENNSLDELNAHTGYRSNGVAYAAGKVSQAFSFTNDSAVFISNTPAFNLTNYSFEAWIKPTAKPNNLEHQGVIISQPYGSGSLMVRSANTGVVVTLLYDQPSWYREVVSSELPLNQFAHVVGTFDGTTLRMYINGVLQAQNTPNLPCPGDNGNAFYLGGLINHTYNAYVECFRGLIDEPSIYNRALSSNEIAALYQAGAAGKCEPVSVPCTPAPSGLVGWWPGENNSLDALNAHTGYRSNGVAYAVGKVGQAFFFTNDSAVFISNTPAFNLTSYSFEAWIKPTAKPNNLEHQGVIISQPYGSGSLMVRSANTGVVVTLLYDQPSWYREVVSSELPLNQFAHVVGTFDGTTLRMYINGVLQAQNTPDLPCPGDNGNAFYLGGLINHAYNAYVECFRGLIDEPSIYNRALSSNEIAALYQAGAGGKCEPVSVPCTPAPSGLVGWWPGENNSLDALNKHTGYRSNGVAYAAGKVGQAFSFTNDSAVFISNTPAFNLNTYSFEAWIKPTAKPNNLEHQGVIISQPYGSGSLMVRSANTGVVVTLLYDQPSWYREVVSSELPLNQFAHVVGTFDGTTLRMYINGVLQAQNTPDLPCPGDNGNAFYLGGLINHAYNAYVECFRGLIDEPSIYNRALSSNEIAALYQAGAAGKCEPVLTEDCTPAPSGLVGWWKGEGNSLDALNAHTGYRSNGVAYAAGKVGQSFSFTNDSAVFISNAPAFNLNTYSFEAWIKPTAKPNNLEHQGVIISQPYGSGSLMVRSANTGVVVTLLYDQPSWYREVVSSELPLNQFAHVVGTFDGATLRMYINGVLQAQNTPDLPCPGDNGNAFYLGGLINHAYNAYVECFRGLIDEPSIYNRALSAGEIAALYQAGAAGKCAGAIPPTITAQPQDLAVCAGTTATFTVTAGGTAPLHYQWKFNGAKINGATSASLTLTNVQSTNVGPYSVTVTNGVGSITSSNALLTLRPPCPAVLHCVNFDPCAGQFCFNVNGETNLHYIVECSTNLNHWTPIATNCGPFQFTDFNIGNEPMKFYRTRPAP